MALGILASEESWYYRDLARAAGDLGLECHRLEFPRLRGGIRANREAVAADPLEQFATFDAVIVRTMPPGSLEQVVYRMDALARWTAIGVRVVNSPKALECAVDKYLTTARLAAAGLPVPDTIVCETAEDALHAWEELDRDVVVKPLFGSEGRGIIRVTDADLAWRAFTTLERLGAVLYLQRFVPHGGCDVRVMVLGDRVLGGMRRCAVDDFRTNIARQGSATAHQPTDQEAEWALRAARATGADIAGIDLLWDQAGQGYVIEVNAVPGWKAFARVNEMDVAAEFMKWLLR